MCSLRTYKSDLSIYVSRMCERRCHTRPQCGKSPTSTFSLLKLPNITTEEDRKVKRSGIKRPLNIVAVWRLISICLLVSWRGVITEWQWVESCGTKWNICKNIDWSFTAKLLFHRNLHSWNKKQKINISLYYSSLHSTVNINRGMNY